MQIRAISDTGGSERTRHEDSQTVACNSLMCRIGTCSVLSSQIAESIAPFACSGTSRGSKIRVANPVASVKCRPETRGGGPRLSE